MMSRPVYGDGFWVGWVRHGPGRPWRDLCSAPTASECRGYLRGFDLPRRASRVILRAGQVPDENQAQRRG